MENTMMNHEAIRKQIDELPICHAGKEAVADLLKEFGYEAPRQLRYPQKGEVWKDNGGKRKKQNFILITEDGTDLTMPSYVPFHLTNLPSIHWETLIEQDWISKGLIEYYAANLDEFVEKYCDSKLNTPPTK